MPSEAETRNGQIKSLIRIIKLLENYTPAVNNRVLVWIAELEKDGWRFEEKS